MKVTGHEGSGGHVILCSAQDDMARPLFYGMLPVCLLVTFREKRVKDVIEFLLLLNVRGMPAILEDHFAVGAAVCLILVENRAYLLDHWLWWEDIGAGPTGDEAELPKKAHVEKRAIGDDLVVCATHPEDGRLLAQVRKRRLVGVAGGQRVVDALRSRRDIRPVLGGGRVTGIVARPHARRENRGHVDLFAVGRDLERRLEVEGIHHSARRVL